MTYIYIYIYIYACFPVVYQYIAQNMENIYFFKFCAVGDSVAEEQTLPQKHINHINNGNYDNNRQLLQQE